MYRRLAPPAERRAGRPAVVLYAAGGDASAVTRDKSPAARTLDEILRILKPLFVEEGFRKMGRSYNRTSEDGLVHVVNFQMSQFPIGVQTPIPGFAVVPYGLCWVNLGVHVPEIAAAGWGEVDRTFYAEHHCQLRERLASGAEHGAWDLARDARGLADDVRRVYADQGFDFFRRLRTRDAVVAEWRESGTLPFCNGGLATAFVAVILARRGEVDEARTLFRRVYERASKEHVPFAKFVAERAALLGVPI